MTDLVEDDQVIIKKASCDNRRFFGRRKTKPLSPLQQSFYQKAENELFFDYTQFSFFQNLFTDNTKKLILEIGFGGGEHLVHQAKINPDINYIGIDAFVNGVSKIVRSIYQENIKNIRISDGDALDVLKYIPENGLDGIYLLYPDPWPKKRHRHRRFIQKDTAQMIEKILKPNGFFRFASDIPAYIEWVMTNMTHHTNAYIDLKQNPDTSFENWISTRYEQKALREDRTPAYYQFFFKNTCI